MNNTALSNTELPFKKEHTYILCVDSDGCVMDTMNYKHIKCFGPLAADMWHIRQREHFLTQWNTINLFSKNRGTNRFKGLVLTLEAVREREPMLSDFAYLAEWVRMGAILSNAALQKAIETAAHTVPTAYTAQLEQALQWSIRVNERIQSLQHEAQPFQGVLPVLKHIHSAMHLTVISSANREAIESEWERHGLIRFVNRIYGQEVGNKANCIKKILAYGFAPGQVLMVGDSPGDMQAAETSGVLFYPILFGKEPQSWEQLQRTALPKLLDGSYCGVYQENLKKEFAEHLGM